MRVASAEEFRGMRQVILMDLEFTCWEGSLRSGWADPARPAEVIEVGLAAWDLRADQAIDTFSRVVRPRHNPNLSEYCMALVGIPQAEIDDAPLLPDVLAAIVRWRARLDDTAVSTCAWGAIDRRYLAADARRSGCQDPFAASPHADLQILMRGVLPTAERAPLERDDVRSRLGLAPNLNRHRALDDALDLAQFCRRLLPGGNTTAHPPSAGARPATGPGESA